MKTWVPLIGRALLVAIYMMSGVGKILHPEMTKSYMAAAGMPLVSLFLVLAILAEIGGSLSVLLGLLTRWGAVVLIVFLFPATLIFHTNFGDHVQWIMFQKNVSMLGGLIMLAIAGPGDWSLDKRLLKL